MSDLVRDFEWRRDGKGYRLEELSRPWKDLPLGVLQAIDYKGDPSAKPIVVRRKGGQLRVYRPLAEVDTLYLIFAALRTSEDVLNFVERFGSLTRFGEILHRGDFVPLVLDQAAIFRNWIGARSEKRAALAKRINQDLNKISEGLNASLVVDAKGWVRLQVTPYDLLGGLWLQLALKLSGQTTVRACLHCGHWFEAGIRSGRRADAKFCSDEHRITFNSLKRTKEK
jgi:hypothetical protein